MHKILLIVLAVCLVGLIGCVNPPATKQTLANSGYSKIETGGWSPFVCGKDDTFATKFTAVNPAGQRVSGTVCCGMLFKGCTVRY